MKINAFYKIIFIFDIVCGFLIYLYSITCTLIFCGIVVIYIPIVWGFSLIPCILYFFISKKYSSENSAYMVSIIMLLFLVIFFKIINFYG